MAIPKSTLLGFTLRKYAPDYNKAEERIRIGDNDYCLSSECFKALANYENYQPETGQTAAFDGKKPTRQHILSLYLCHDNPDLQLTTEQADQLAAQYLEQVEQKIQREKDKIQQALDHVEKQRLAKIGDPVLPQPDAVASLGEGLSRPRMPARAAAGFIMPSADRRLSPDEKIKFLLKQAEKADDWETRQRAISVLQSHLSDIGVSPAIMAQLQFDLAQLHDLQYLAFPSYAITRLSDENDIKTRAPLLKAVIDCPQADKFLRIAAARQYINICNKRIRFFAEDKTVFVDALSQAERMQPSREPDDTWPWVDYLCWKDLREIRRKDRHDTREYFSSFAQNKANTIQRNQNEIAALDKKISQQRLEIEHMQRQVAQLQQSLETSSIMTSSL